MRNLNIKRWGRVFFAVFVALLLVNQGFGQSAIASGNWNSNATWSCNCIPTTGAITIGGNFIVTVPLGYTPTATSLTVQNTGTLRNQSTGNLSGLTSITFQNGSTYEHNVSGGVIPTATWNSGSTVLITGNPAGTTALPSGLGQSFHHFTYNPTLQTGVNLSFGGNLTTVNGNLTIVNTGNLVSGNNRQITLGSSSAGSNGTLNIGGSLTISNYSRVQFGGSGTSFTVNIAGDFNLNALQQIPGAPTPINNVVLNVSNANTTVNVTGNLNINSDARFNMVTGSGAQTNLNVRGNFSFTNGVFTRDATAATANFNFAGLAYNIGTDAGLQLFTGGGSFSGAGQINYRVISTAGVDLRTYGLGLNGTFVNDGVVKLGSTNNTGAIVGNIVPNNRTFSAGSTIIYNGLAEQSIGSTHPSGTSVTTTIANSSHVRLVDNATIGGTLNLTSGDILIDNRRLTLLGTVNPGTRHLIITSSSSIEIGGSGAFGTLPISGGTDINGFTINRTGGSVEIEQDLTVQGTLAQTAGDIILEGFTLTLNGPFTRTSGTIISSNPASNFEIAGAGAVPTIGSFSGTFSTFDYNRDATIMGTNTAFTVDNLLLRRGTLNNGSDLIISSGGTIQRFVGDLGNPVDGTGPLFITYSNQQDIFSGPELTPVNTERIEDVVVNGSANVFLASNVTINDDFTISSGGLFGQASNITLNGDLTVDGLADFSEATIIFDGNTTVSGAALPQFGTLQVTSGNTLTLPSSVTVSVAGDIDFSATSTVNATNISLNLNGGVPQTISVNDLTINDMSVSKSNDTGVTLASDISVLGEVSVLSPNTEIASVGFLRLISTSDAGGTGDAWIGPLVDGASVTGVVHVERYMSDEGNLYRYLSSPTDGMSVDDLNNFMPVTGNFPGSTVCVSCTNLPSMHTYNNATLSYNQFPVSSISETMGVGVGYATFVYQNAVPGPRTLDFAGEINMGQIPLPVAFNAGSPTNSWNLVGNPYPSTIDWDDETGGWVKGVSINPGIAVHDNGEGVFKYWDGVDGTLTDGLIAKGQAFWVHTNNNTDLTLEINELAKAPPAEFLRTAGSSSDRLVLKLTNNAGLSDHAFLKERTNAKLSTDFFDVPKLNNQAFDLSTYSIEETKTALAINAIEHADCIEKLGIVTKDLTVGDYTLSVEMQGTFGNKTWKLFDKFTNTTIDFGDEDSYPLSVTTDPASAAIDRFELILEVPRPNLTLNVEALTPNVCDEVAVISIPQAETIFKYEVLVNGISTGNVMEGKSDLAIKVDNSLLQSGENDIAVLVTGGCPLTLNKTVSVTKHALVAAVAPSKVECVPGSYVVDASGGDAFNWYDSENSETVLATGNSYTTPSLTSTATYYVAAVNTNGCEGPRVATTVTITMPVAVDIVISTAANQLTSTYVTGNQWSFNGAIIEGATGPTIDANEDGLYTLTVTIDNCSLSKTIDYVVSGLEAEAVQSLAWPNPVAEKLTIDIPPGLKVHSLWLQTTSGSVAEKHRNPRSQVTIDMSQYSPGLYFLMMDTDRGRRVEKIIRN